MLVPHSKECYYAIEGVASEESYLDSMGTSSGITQVTMVDTIRDVSFSIKTSKPFILLRYPVYTVSQSDSGFEKNYQGSCMVLCFEMNNSLHLDCELTIQ